MKDDDIDIDEAIDKVMQDSMTRVAEIAASNKNSSMSILNSKARKT